MYVSYTISTSDLEQEIKEIEADNGKVINIIPQSTPYYLKEKGVWVSREDLAVFLEVEYE
jgi:hypothetical protein